MLKYLKLNGIKLIDKFRIMCNYAKIINMTK